MDANNSYTQMQKKYYEENATIMAVEDHRGHNNNPDYYGILLSDITTNPEYWTGKTALDFGCGTGRNIANLYRLAKWKFVDGCDIARNNLYEAHRLLTERGVSGFTLYPVSGVDLGGIPSKKYDFVMSTIVLQHIAVWSIRLSILTDIFRVMKSGGLFSFQVVKYPLPRDRYNIADYHEDKWDAPNTNGGYDFSVDNEQDLINDLTRIGFEVIETISRPEWEYINQEYAHNNNRWVFVKARKP